jgi:hypothetical protein
MAFDKRREYKISRQEKKDQTMQQSEETVSNPVQYLMQIA